MGISALALWLGRETFTQDVTHWLQIGSGVIVVLLGSWMLVKRVRQMNRAKHHHHHHAPEPVLIKNALANGVLEIVDTPDGERMKFTPDGNVSNLSFRVLINRLEGPEILNMSRSADSSSFLSETTPSEPHEFTAEFEITKDSNREVILFEMHEPHDHDHSHMSDDEHAKAHASTMPEYAKRGERPTLGQILAFGAAGGMIPCPASITVMLLALSIGKFALGILAVAGFSIGLAVTLVGIGLLVVAGLSRIQGSSGRLHWLSAKAPILSAGVVILSGLAALLFAH